MDFVTILELFAAIITAFGGIELIKVLLHKREDKKKLSAEAEVVEAEAAKAAEEARDAKYTGVIEGYESFYNRMLRIFSIIKIL